MPVIHTTVPPPLWPTLFPYTTLFRSVGPRRRAFGDRASAYLIGQRPTPFMSTPEEKGRTAEELAALLGGRVRECRQLRSEEHTSELQSRFDLVCRLLLEKKNIERRLQ